MSYTWSEIFFADVHQDDIPSWAQASPEQWTVIYEYILFLKPLTSSSRAALWQQEANPGLHFTEFYDCLRRDIAKKHSTTLADLRVDLLLAVPGAAALGANNRKFIALIFRIDQHVNVKNRVLQVLAAYIASATGMIGHLLITEKTDGLAGYRMSHRGDIWSASCLS